MCSLAQDCHLVVVGKFVPEAYRVKVHEQVERLGVASRVHFRDFLPYEELSDYCNSATVGVIVRDPKIVNNYISLPNRIFDYLSAELPVVTPFMPDIAKIVGDYKCGVVINDIDAKSWIEGISKALTSAEELKDGAKTANKGMTWEFIEENKLLVAFQNVSSVTFVGFNKLAKNNRTMRMAQSLERAGVKVKIVSHWDKGDTLPDGVEKIVVGKE